MTQKRNTRGAAATAVAPSASEPVLKWVAHMINGRTINFDMTNAELTENMNGIWFQLDSGMILVTENIVLIGVQGKV